MVLAKRLRARYYDPLTSRFISVDPMYSSDISPYAYAGNNPLKYVDPSGNQMEIYEAWSDSTLNLVGSEKYKGTSSTVATMFSLTPNLYRPYPGEKLLSLEYYLNLDAKNPKKTDCYTFVYERIKDLYPDLKIKKTQEGRGYNMIDMFVALKNQKGWKVGLILNVYTNEEIIKKFVENGYWGIEVDFVVTDDITNSEKFSSVYQQLHGVESFGNALHSGVLARGRSVEAHIGRIGPGTIGSQTLDEMYSLAWWVAIPPEAYDLLQKNVALPSRNEIKEYLENQKIQLIMRP